MPEAHSRRHDPPGLQSLRWMDDARCRGMDPAIFFPERAKPGTNGSEITNEARAVCSRCPVVEQCRQYARSGPWGRFGVWGGETERQRYPRGGRVAPAYDSPTPGGRKAKKTFDPKTYEGKSKWSHD